MAQQLTKVKGLFTYPSEISEVPDGALFVADDCVIDRDSVIEARTGFNTYQTISGNANDRAKQILQYQGKLITHYGSALEHDSAGTAITITGTFDPPTHGDSYVPKIRSAELNSNFYFTSNTGIQKMDVYTGTPVNAGAPQALDLSLALVGGGTGFTTGSDQVAYRIVWGYTDANNNLVLGAPSQRTVITNATAGASDVSLTFTVPSGITTSYVFQVYRSALSGSSTVSPNDELGLVYTRNPTSGEIAAKSVTVTDSTPDSLRGASLYTNASQQGIGQANSRPPSAKDIAAFKNSLFLANTISKQSLTLTLVSVAGTNGVAINDVITIAGITYTGKASESVASNQFKVDTGGTPSQNIDNTAQSLCRVINQSATNTLVYAYYISTLNDLPGKIYLEARTLGASSFAVVASAHPAAWNPQLQTSGTTVQSTNSQYQNQLYFSKTQQPEAFPLLNYVFVGAASSPIYRIIPLRESLIILKSEGVFRLTGDQPSNFVVDILDNTVNINAPETAVKLNNQIFACTNQGVCTITDTGVGVISRPIENKLLPLFQYANFATASFAVAYETKRRYILALPTSAGDTKSTQQFVWNTFTTAWTRWTKSVSAGLVASADDKLYFGSSGTNTLIQERKNQNYTDYADEDYAVTITGVSGATVTLASPGSVSVGDTITQGVIPFSKVISINLAASTITLDVARSWANGTATMHKGIASIVTWAPQFCGNPGVMKHIREIQVLLKDKRFTSATLSFNTNLVKAKQSVTLTGNKSNLWGYFAWGSGPFGGNTDPDNARTYIPDSFQRCSWINTTWTHSAAYGVFAIDALSYIYTPMSERTTS